MAKSVRQELEVIRFPKRSTTILLIIQIYLVKHEMPIFQCIKDVCFIFPKIPWNYTKLFHSNVTSNFVCFVWFRVSHKFRCLQLRAIFPSYLPRVVITETSHPAQPVLSFLKSKLNVILFCWIFYKLYINFIFNRINLILFSNHTLRQISGNSL